MSTKQRLTSLHLLLEERIDKCKLAIIEYEDNYNFYVNNDNAHFADVCKNTIAKSKNNIKTLKTLLDHARRLENSYSQVSDTIDKKIDKISKAVYRIM